MGVGHDSSQKADKNSSQSNLFSGNPSEQNKGLFSNSTGKEGVGHDQSNNETKNPGPTNLFSGNPSEQNKGLFSNNTGLFGDAHEQSQNKTKNPGPTNLFSFNQGENGKGLFSKNSEINLFGTKDKPFFNKEANSKEANANEANAKEANAEDKSDEEKREEKEAMKEVDIDQKFKIRTLKPVEEQQSHLNNLLSESVENFKEEPVAGAKDKVQDTDHNMAFGEGKIVMESYKDHSSTFFRFLNKALQIKGFYQVLEKVSVPQ